ncbi:M15 family metallopeptidase [Paenibacillus nasutitermitis]|uniref:Carboxypeptidase YodJ n=1 Tax=Paenibacillus nasutitermitis TaxID=1652958 RepID=A0A916YY51_9BACL|nr:M15 family metallopeptidase [Paenibacillus nasutitermitis]GGD66805.1 putative carboxypeptidase YodJ [Paenibacillus nasutitermitis]
MKKTRRKTGRRLAILMLLVCTFITVVTIENINADKQPIQDENPMNGSENNGPSTGTVQPGTDKPTGQKPETGSNQAANGEPSPVPDENNSPNNDDSIVVVAQPESVTALINKHFALPDDYKPSDLVYPDVPFIFAEKIEKRKMRKAAADALEKMFAAAREDGLPLSGVSAYRSYSTQKTLFDRYVRQDGWDKARTYSAVPGTSEHQTGLAIDVTARSGKCAASDCFGGTKEAVWIARHASEYGFIIRYPEGKDALTGYKYEPWHIRYVGEEIAAIIASGDLTLEQYAEQHGDGSIAVTD